MADVPQIAIVGPALPFRGGIAQHTTMLARALSEKAEVRTYSFSRQYPAVLFPGETDRDPAYEGHLEPNTSYGLDTVNPLSWRRTMREIRSWGPEAVVMPWWHVYFAPCFGYLASACRRAGITVVFLCHNVIEHETAPWRRALTRRTLQRGDAFLVHTKEDEANLSALLPGAGVSRSPHPVYDTFPPPEPPPREHDLELLFFGFVRPYKGLDVLIEAMALVDPQLDVRLTIAGEFWGGPQEAEELIATLGVGRRVDIVPGYLTEDQVGAVFSRSDVVVLPYRSATGSGVVALAYAYGHPVIVTDVGGLPDVVEDGRTGFIVPADSPEALASAIERASSADRASMTEAVRRYAEDELSWERLADTALTIAVRPRARQR